MLSIFIYLCVLALSLGQFSLLTKTQSGGFYLFDILIALFAFSGLIVLFSQREDQGLQPVDESVSFHPQEKRRLRTCPPAATALLSNVRSPSLNKGFKFPKYSLYFYAFTFLGLIGLIPSFFKLGLDDFLVSSSYLLRWFLYLTSSVIVFNMLEKKLITENTLIKLFLYSALFISIAGFIQLLILPDFTVLGPSSGWDPHKNRLASTFFDPNFTGGYLVLCITLALYSNTLKKFNIKQKIIFLLVPVIALILTFSRSSWAALSLVVLIYGVFRNRKLLLIFALLMFLVYFAVPRVQTRLSGITDPADSAHFRLISWSNTWEIAKDNLFLGTGYNTFRFVQKEYGFFDPGEFGGNAGGGSDSSFLLLLATTGIAGTFLFIKGFITPILNTFSKNDRASKILSLATVVPLFAHSQFVNSVFYPQILFLWLSIFAIAAQRRGQTKRALISYPCDKLQ